MNNLYQWHDDWMAELEMRQVRQEMEHVRMLREAGLTGDGWVIRAGRALAYLLAAGWRKMYGLRSVERASQQSGSKKFV